MILYQSIGLYYYHLVLVVDVWVGEQGGFSAPKRAGLACPTPYITRREVFCIAGERELLTQKGVQSRKVGGKVYT